GPALSRLGPHPGPVRSGTGRRQIEQPERTPRPAARLDPAADVAGAAVRRLRGGAGRRGEPGSARPARRPASDRRAGAPPDAAARRPAAAGTGAARGAAAGTAGGVAARGPAAATLGAGLADDPPGVGVEVEREGVPVAPGSRRPPRQPADGGPHSAG